MTNRNLRAAGLLSLPGLALPLFAQQTDSLSVAGQAGSARVVQVDGHNYVEVEGFARLTNAAISFRGNQIVITLPDFNKNPPVSAPAPAGFSKDFVTAGVEAMAEQREWHAALKNAIERRYPLAESWLSNLRAKAQQALRIASVSTSTAADKDALPFLTSQLNNMGKLSDKYLKMSLSRTYIDSNSFNKDALNQKIVACTHALASMATANQFVDDGSCR
ncbi:MAG TPA: hypothetical protein VK789_32175 [Bryobacteraceae bacterium]|nr:hypothetical protein [Bryobacteraceae bacterium]